jgi:GrpB-like predicted nucleotidyltransferase (UPF0157 family)
MEIRPERELRDQVAREIERNTAVLAGLLPGSEVEHIGATSVPGSLTKGDVDLLVRVPAEDFGPAVETLGTRYRRHYPEEWTPTLASFKEQPEQELPVGILLVVAGGVNDRLFIEWRDRLRSEPELLERYNAFKAEHADLEYQPYTDAKGKLIEEHLGRGLGPE